MGGHLGKDFQDNSIRVIYTVGTPIPGGGVGNLAYFQARTLLGAGYLKGLCCARLDESLSSEVKLWELPFWAGGVQRILARIFPRAVYYYYKDQLYDLLSRGQINDRFNVVHGWGDMSLFTFTKAKKTNSKLVLNATSSHPKTQNRLLAEEYGQWGIKDPPVYHRFIKKLMREIELADFLVAGSQWVIDSYIDEGVAPEKMLLNPSGVDTEHFRPAAEPKDGPFRIVFVGRISLRKGVYYLLEAYRRLALKNAELLLFGGLADDSRKVLERYRDLKGLKIAKGDPLPVYQSADVFCLPSVEEGSSLASYEALACGLPSVVSTNCGSVVRDGVDGFVVGIRNVEQLVEKIGLLYEDHNLRREMGLNARKRAEEFTWGASGQGLLRLYREKILSVT